LAAIGRGEPKVIDFLVDALKHEQDTSLRISAAEALADMGPSATEAIPTLISLAEHLESSGSAQHHVLRLRCIFALGRVATESERAVKALIGLLEHKDSSLRAAAASSLAAIGPFAKAAVPALKRAAEDDDSMVAAKAQEALLRLEPKE